MKKIILMLSVGIFLYSCDSSKKVPNELITKIQKSYNEDINLDEQENFNKNVNSNKNVKRKKGLFKRKPKLAEVKEPTLNDSVTLPNWITNKEYVSENVDAIKYKPALLLGALVKKLDENRFEIYSVTYNVRSEDEVPVLSKIEKPTNFFEQTFDQSTRFNSDFIIGGASIGNEEIMKLTYTETNYGNLEKYDEVKLNNLRTTINDIQGVNKKDWAIIRGVVLLDCTSSKSQKTEMNANIKASWITANGEYFKQTGNTNNFRLLSIDLENLFLNP